MLRQGASAAHNLVQKTLERALTLDPDRVTAGPDMALAPIPEGDIETLHEAQASLDAVVAQGTSVLGPIEAAVGKASEDTELAEGEATKALGRARNATRAMYRSKHRAGDATIEIESASEAQTYAKAKAAASTAHLAALLVELRKNQHALGTQVDVDNNGMRRTIIALQNKRIALQKEEWRLKNMISKLKKEAAKDTNGTANNATRDSASAASTEAASEAAVLTAEAEVADAKSDVDTAVKDINDAWAEENSMSLLQEQERSKTRQNTQGRRLRARAVLRYDAADEILASEGDRLTGLEKQLGMLTPEQQQQHHRFAGQATTAAATPAGEASVENANDVLAKKVSKLEKLRARRPNATAVWAGEGSGGEGKQHEGVLFSGRNSLKEVLVARQVVEAKIQQIRQDMQNVSLRSRNATALAKQVMVVQRQIKRAQGLDSFRKKEIVLTTARKAKADAYVRECMADIAHSTSAYEGAMVALRKARDVVTRTKRRLYLLEKEVSFLSPNPLSSPPSLPLFPPLPVLLSSHTIFSHTTYRNPPPYFFLDSSPPYEAFSQRHAVCASLRPYPHQTAATCAAVQTTRCSNAVIRALLAHPRRLQVVPHPLSSRPCRNIVCSTNMSISLNRMPSWPEWPKRKRSKARKIGCHGSRKRYRRRLCLSCITAKSKQIRIWRHSKTFRPMRSSWVNWRRRNKRRQQETSESTTGGSRSRQTNTA